MSGDRVPTPATNHERWSFETVSRYICGACLVVSYRILIIFPNYSPIFTALQSWVIGVASFCTGRYSPAPSIMETPYACNTHNRHPRTARLTVLGFGATAIHAAHGGARRVARRTRLSASLRFRQRLGADARDHRLPPRLRLPATGAR